MISLKLQAGHLPRIVVAKAELIHKKLNLVFFFRIWICTGLCLADIINGSGPGRNSTKRKLQTNIFSYKIAHCRCKIKYLSSQVYRNKLAKLGRTQSSYLLQNYPASSQPDYYPPHRDQQGYYPPHQQGQGGHVQQQEDWSNGYPDQEGDYPAELGYYPKANGQNPAFNGGYPAHIRQQHQQYQQQQYQQQHFAAAGSRYIDQLNAQQQHYY